MKVFELFQEVGTLLEVEEGDYVELQRDFPLHTAKGLISLKKGQRLKVFKVIKSTGEDRGVMVAPVGTKTEPFRLPFSNLLKPITETYAPAWTSAVAQVQRSVASGRKVDAAASETAVSFWKKLGFESAEDAEPAILNAYKKRKPK